MVRQAELDRLVQGGFPVHSCTSIGYAHLPFVDLATGRIAIAMRNASFGFRQLTNEDLAKRLTFTREFRSNLFCAT